MPRRAEELILDKLLRKSQEERKLAARYVSKFALLTCVRLQEKRERKLLIKDNCIKQEQEHTVSRQKQWEQELQRDSEIGKDERKKYEEQVYYLYTYLH